MHLPRRESLGLKNRTTYQKRQTSKPQMRTRPRFSIIKNIVTPLWKNKKNLSKTASGTASSIRSELNLALAEKKLPAVSDRTLRRDIEKMDGFVGSRRRMKKE
jgi:hypothetical protein